MYCVNCGSHNDDSVSYCSSCGARVTPNTQQQFNQGYNNNQGYQGYSNYSPPPSFNKPVSNDKADVLIILVAVLWPLIGLIMYFVWKDEKPVAAKTCLKAAAISFVVSIGLVILFYVIFFIMVIAASSNFSVLLLI